MTFCIISFRGVIGLFVYVCCVEGTFSSIWINIYVIQVINKLCCIIEIIRIGQCYMLF
jgi:hypothetical protein